MMFYLFHAAIRSGDYYMFEEVEDEDMAMIDSITEEEEDSDDRPAGFTLSEVSARNRLACLLISVWIIFNMTL